MIDLRRPAPVSFARAWRPRATTPLLTMLIAAAACGGGQGPGAVVEGTPPQGEVLHAKATANGAPQDLWGPSDILALIEASNVDYVITSRPSVASLPLKAATASSLLHPLAAVNVSTGEPVLELQIPPDQVQALLHQGATLATEGRYGDAVPLYAQAVALEPGYAKGHTLLGNALIMVGDIQRGCDELQQALTLNPIDYQAHFFLATTYFQIDRMDLAMDHITQAFLLNRSDPHLLSAVETILEANGLTLAPTPLTVPAHLEDMGPDKIAVVVEEENGAEWLALMLCLAAWTKEPQLRARREPGDNLDHKMYRECLVNQAVITEGLLAQGGDVSPAARQILAATRGGFLDAMIMWEVHALEEAAIIAVQSPEAREHIAEYIRLFVYRPADSI